MPSGHGAVVQLWCGLRSHAFVWMAENTAERMVGAVRIMLVDGLVFFFGVFHESRSEA